MDYLKKDNSIMMIVMHPTTNEEQLNKVQRGLRPQPSRAGSLNERSEFALHRNCNSRPLSLRSAYSFAHCNFEFALSAAGSAHSQFARLSHAYGVHRALRDVSALIRCKITCFFRSCDGLRH